MKVHELKRELDKLDQNSDIGLADPEHGVVEIRAIEADEENKIYRLI